jgi:hypothetical protein
VEELESTLQIDRRHVNHPDQHASCGMFVCYFIVGVHPILFFTYNLRIIRPSCESLERISGRSARNE